MRNPVKNPYGSRNPIPALNIRCQWCKQLFVWKPRFSSNALQFKIPKTCGKPCKSRLISWERDRVRIEK